MALLSTQIAYEDPVIVDGYVKRNSQHLKNIDSLTKFTQYVKGKEILDLGCGPGHDSYYLVENGYDVTGLDYSNEMIRRAKVFNHIPHPPKFMVGDMRLLPNYFPNNQFDGIWACASLLHLKQEDIPKTLQGVNQITKRRAIVHISLKQGQGTQLIHEDKLGKPMTRQFTLWTKDTFYSKHKPCHGNY